LIGKGGLSDLADAMGDLKDSTDKFKDIMKDSEKDRKCPERDEVVCKVQNLVDKLGRMQDKAREGAKEEIKSLGGILAESLPGSVWETPTKNTIPNTTPIDNNTTGATSCKEWWAALEGKDSNVTTIFSALMCK
jgi:hypothetical protein